jgi:hypothetical protein
MIVNRPLKFFCAEKFEKCRERTTALILKMRLVLLNCYQNQVYISLLPESIPVREIVKQALKRMHVNSEPHPFWEPIR